MATTFANTSSPLNPNAHPWQFLPHQIYQTTPTSTSTVHVALPQPLLTAPVVVHYDAAVYYFHVAPVYQAVRYYYPVTAPPPQRGSPAYSGGLCGGEEGDGKKTTVMTCQRKKGKRGFCSPLKPRYTTVMIRNIPNQFSRKMLVDFLDQLCHSENANSQQQPHPVRVEYDFLYLPMDFVRGNNLGYAFVNFTRPFAARKVWRLLEGYKWGVFEDCYGCVCESNKICEISWARIQGKEDLVTRFINSRFVCNSIEYLPVVFTPPRDGCMSSPAPRAIGSCRGSTTASSSGGDGTEKSFD